MLHVRRRVGALLALGAVLVIGGGCGDQASDAGPGLPAGGWSTVGCEVTREPGSITAGGLAMPSTPVALSEAMGRIERGGRVDFGDSYAGLEVDQENVRAIVYRVPSAAFDDFIRVSARETCVTVRDAPYSAVALAVWHDRVLADLPFWTDRGIRIVALGARHDGTGLEIGTQDYERAKLELPARYGSRSPLLFIEHPPVRPLEQRSRAVQTSR